ncbi:MAG: sigma-70 family RNA polymerase sigma factor [Gammaproteobacteria bacterium]
MTEAQRHTQFESIVGKLAPDLFRYAYWLSRDRQLAEDVVQETMIRAYKNLEQLRDATSAKHWLFTIVRREHARTFERKRLDLVDIDTPGMMDDSLATPDFNHDVNAVREALAELETDYREPLVLQILLGHSVKEIAELLELGEGAVLTRLFRARKKLKVILETKH